MITALVLGLFAGTGTALIVASCLRPAPAIADPRGRGPVERLDELLLRAGLGRVPGGAVVFLTVLLTVVTAAAALALTGVVIVGIVGATVGAGIPFALLNWRVRQRRRAHRDVWPDAVDHLVASIRSGRGLADAVEQLASAGPEPLRDEFRSFGVAYRATGSFDHAVNETKDRLGDPTADRLLETLRMARQVGGTELVAVLRALGGYLREEQSVRREAEARQSWVMNAARLGVVAPWLVLLMLASRPEAAAAYNTATGTLVILAGLGITVAAYQVMVRVGRFDDEGRWFA